MPIILGGCAEAWLWPSGGNLGTRGYSGVLNVLLAHNGDGGVPWLRNRHPNKGFGGLYSSVPPLQHRRTVLQHGSRKNNMPARSCNHVRCTGRAAEGRYSAVSLEVTATMPCCTTHLQPSTARAGNVQSVVRAVLTVPYATMGHDALRVSEWDKYLNIWRRVQGCRAA